MYEFIKNLIDSYGEEIQVFSFLIPYINVFYLKILFNFKIIVLCV